MERMWRNESGGGFKCIGLGLIMYTGPSLSAYSHWGVAFGAGRADEGIYHPAGFCPHR